MYGSNHAGETPYSCSNLVHILSRKLGRETETQRHGDTETQRGRATKRDKGRERRMQTVVKRGRCRKCGRGVLFLGELKGTSKKNVIKEHHAPPTIISSTYPKQLHFYTRRSTRDLSILSISPLGMYLNILH